MLYYSLSRPRTTRYFPISIQEVGQQQSPGTTIYIPHLRSPHTTKHTIPTSFLLLKFPISSFFFLSQILFVRVFVSTFGLWRRVSGGCGWIAGCGLYARVCGGVGLVLLWSGRVHSDLICIWERVRDSGSVRSVGAGGWVLACLLACLLACVRAGLVWTGWLVEKGGWG